MNGLATGPGGQISLLTPGLWKHTGPLEGTGQGHLCSEGNSYEGNVITAKGMIVKMQACMCVLSGEAGSSEQTVPCELGGETQKQLGWGRRLKAGVLESEGPNKGAKIRTNQLFPFPGECLLHPGKMGTAGHPS